MSSVLLGTDLGVELLGHAVTLPLSLEEPHSGFQSGCIVLHFLQEYEGSTWVGFKQAALAWDVSSRTIFTAMLWTAACGQ